MYTCMYICGVHADIRTKKILGKKRLKQKTEEKNKTNTWNHLLNVSILNNMLVGFKALVY